MASSQFHFDEDAAERVVNFFHLFLKHGKGGFAGQPFDLLPWQEKITREVFGWKRADGYRRYRRCYVEVAKKMGKSSWGAGIALYLLFADNEPGAEVISAACDASQAGIVFEIAKEMVESEMDLRKQCDVWRRSIVVSKSASNYKVLSADVKSKHGANLHGIIFDELHTQPTRELWDTLTKGTGARRQPLTVAMTTAGWDRKSICWEIHDYAIKVRDGIIQDDEFLPVIFAADEKDDWTSPATWAKANPSLGVTVQPEYLEAECRRAQEMPGEQNTFKRLYLNLWTEQSSRWVDTAVWDEGGDAFDEDALEGQACWAGLDLSSTQDVTALVLDFPQADGSHIWLPRFWVPEEGIIKRSRSARVPYGQWRDQGYIEATEGNVVDYDRIRLAIRELGERYNIREIAIDRWNSTQLQTQLMGDGFTVVPFGQGYFSMAAPSKEFEKLVVSRQLRHGGNPVLRWMASNVAAAQDPAGNVKPDKARSGEKIDGIVAGIMALGRAMVSKSDGTSVYDDQKESLYV